MGQDWELEKGPTLWLPLVPVTGETWLRVPWGGVRLERRAGVSNRHRGAWESEGPAQVVR
jgi:hypothetical protein